ncbi:ATP-dependent exoDNAse (exonuclease V) beta subunit [Pontibacter ummariensis]|uniref:DNA 3'-5' helicase n=1 Tax=Pontibacter ummariensis TaxID=1610492 RepID=A0A239FNQ0_9BACT|nr:UvrD-helicase domain-containing protein [Pontibacter ummariensis]PRY11992.1 ATP-dependent exoDNAse (exonuclease V) beta subunit [Pontibacter ummariensis]SNS58435.1 ATP-dependent exoDNAse (exonuclease V) beta subunit (contains helicase and exonuclease domains) [Pontibacter ummariensis]
MPSTFKIYSSSAGSGKTYHLTKEYLKLALHSNDPDYYRSVLAITFTNDAAAEMKERILAALRNFNDGNLSEKDKQKSEDLLAGITQDLQREYPEENVDKEEVRRRAASLFRQILYNYSDFSVSTIDSFVNKIVQAFTRELNIPQNFEVDLDSNTLLSTAVSLLLDKVTDSKEDLLSQTLEQYALEKAREGKSWVMLPDDLMDFARNLLNEQVFDAITDLQQLSLEDFKQVREQLYLVQQQIGEAVQEYAQQAMHLFEQADVSPADLYQSTRGIWSYFNTWLKAVDLNYGNSNARKTVEEDKWYGGKATAYAKAQIDQIKQPLTALYYQIESLKEQYAPTFTLVQQVVPHLYKVSLLNELEKCLQEIKQDKNTVHISEFNKRIIDIVLKEPVPFIYERLGEKYRHILIDEFQDTSVLQWNNLLPLVDNALASGHFSMVVGDAKQAIYRWRGGEMEQILHLYKRSTKQLYASRRHGPLIKERYESVDQALQPNNLSTNYRSREEIIHFNNDLFTFISQGHKEFGIFTSIYDKDFTQQIPTGADKRGGHIQIMFTHDDDLNFKYELNSCARTKELYEGYKHEELLTYDESTLNMVLQLVQHGKQEGYALKDMAILCRTNVKSKLIANFLKEKGFPIISQDSLSLQFAEVINLIVAMFRVFNRPHDSLAKTEALYLVCKVALESIPDVEMTKTIADIANEKENQSFFDQLRVFGFDVQERETGNLSIYELTEKLIRIFGLLGKNNESEYLFRFLDLVLEYSLKHSNNLNNFLNYWEVQKEKLSINTPKDRDAITITSIHKSKGLAYPIVIVPFADWSTEPKRGSLMWSQLPEEVTVTGKLRSVAVNISSKLENTTLTQQYSTEIEKTFIENLNMLYVALTRPMDRLYLIGNAKDLLEERRAPKLDGPAKNISHLLYRYLVHKEMWEFGKHCYQLAQGSPQTLQHREGHEKSYYLDHLSSADWEQRLKIKQHANNVFDFETQTVQRQQNRKLHYALARIAFAPELDKVLRQMVYEGIISEREKSDAKQRLKKVLDHPKLRHYFTNQVAVEHEKEVLDARAYLYKPDRIVFDGDAVVLIEFKTPPPEPEHKYRLDHYAVRFRQLGYENVKCLLYYFDTEEVMEWQYGGKKQQAQLGLEF